jgi:2,4-diketo-3-deoxy-L-fuconate hydrolase
MSDFDPVTGLAKGSFGFGTFEHQSRRFPGLVQYGGAVLDLSRKFHDTHEILDDWERNFDLLVDIDAKANGTVVRFDQVRALPPVAHPNIHGAGSNYKQHVVEMLTHGPYSKTRPQPGEAFEDAWKRNTEFVEHRAKYGMPVMFAICHSALCGATDDIIMPAVGKNNDWEMELALVVGSSRRFATPEEARTMIAGYMCINDLATHSEFNRPDVPWQFDMYVKNQPSFKVAGPFIVPAIFINPVRDNIVIKLEVNGESKQNWPVTDMIFSCEKLLVYVSERARLMPGDVIMTGSPPGNASLSGQFLKAGDIVTGSVTGLGRQHNICVDEVLEPGRKPFFGGFSLANVPAER